MGSLNWKRTKQEEASGFNFKPRRRVVDPDSDSVEYNVKNMEFGPVQDLRTERQWNEKIKKEDPN